MRPISVIITIVSLLLSINSSFIKQDDAVETTSFLFSTPDNSSLDKHIHKRGSLAPSTTLSKRLSNKPFYYAEDDITSFHKRLRLHATTEGFEIFGFDFYVNQYRKELSLIEFTVENTPDYKEGEGKRVKLLKDMLYTMMDSCDKLKQYLSSNLPGHEIVYQVIELNIRAWSLYDSYGDIDTSIDESSDVARRLYTKFFTLCDKFATVQDARFSNRTFWLEASRTMKTIEKLKNGERV